MRAGVKGRRSPLAICLGFALVGLVLVVSGAYAGGAICVLFFGVGGLALATPVFTRHDKSTVRIAEIGHEQGFLFPFSRAKQSVTLVATLGMAAAGVVIALSGGVIIGVLCAVVFGGFGALGAKSLAGVRGLGITPTRVVVMAATGGGELDWDDVADAALVRMSRNRMLSINATAPEHVRRAGSDRLAGLNRRLGAGDLVLPADQLAGEPEQAVRALARYFDQPEARAEIGTPQELARLL